MDLNHIELPPFVIADLYRSYLVDSGDTLPGEKASSEETLSKLTMQEELSEWTFLGNNRKHILLITDHKAVTHLPDEELEFLKGILAACKLGMDDVALVNFHHHPEADYKKFSSYFKCKTVILIGVEPVRLGLPMNFPHFQQQLFAGVTYLFSPALNELENDRLLKSKLWVCLKRIFGI